MRPMHAASASTRCWRARRARGKGDTHGGGGGAGLDANTGRYARTTFTVEMARVSPSFTLSYGASLGLFGGNVLGKGTPEQIERFARARAALREDRLLGAHRARRRQRRAARHEDARRAATATRYVLNGSKTFITNAPYADSFLIYARVARRRRSTARSRRSSSSAARPASSTGPPMKKMGMRGSPTGEVFLDDVRVPADQLLGGGVRQRDHVKSSLAVERGGLVGAVLRHRRALLRDRP